MITVRTITPDDDLQSLVDEINQAAWDEANAISTYEAESLSTYLKSEDTLFVACHEVTDDGSTLLGMASGRLEIKPYDSSRWLYVDEVDVCADQRQRGAGKAIMRELLDLADQADCDEVWLATEVDNVAAQSLYQSLGPDDAAEVIGYTYEFED